MIHSLVEEERGALCHFYRKNIQGYLKKREDLCLPSVTEESSPFSLLYTARTWLESVADCDLNPVMSGLITVLESSLLSLVYIHAKDEVISSLLGVI